MTDPKERVIRLVKDDLAAIEKDLKDNINPYLDLVSEVASHILFSGGKRFRPLLMVLSARMCNYGGNDASFFSTAFEYFHAATLLHDDIVDGAKLRRGKEVAHLVWDGATSVLVGDFLLARALSIGAKTGKLRVIQVMSEITENMSQGEIQQLMNKRDLSLTEDVYLQLIQRKTAFLIQGACRVGAIIADAKPQLESALSDFGFHLGIAFQMADDLLDYTAQTVELGKTIGADLREGKLTLPVIYTLGQATPQDRNTMAAIIQKDDFSTEEFEILVRLLNTYGGLEYTAKCAQEHIQKAQNALDIFSPSKTKDILFEIAQYTIARKV